MRGLVQLSRQRGEAVPLRSLYDPGLDLQLTSRRALGESEIHEPNPARPIGRGLGLRKARQAVVANPTQFAVEIRDFRPRFRERFNHARIFVAPIETGPRQQLRPPALDASGHSETVDFDLMEPLWS